MKSQLLSILISQLLAVNANEFPQVFSQQELSSHLNTKHASLGTINICTKFEVSAAEHMVFSATLVNCELHQNDALSAGTQQELSSDPNTNQGPLDLIYHMHHVLCLSC